MVTPEADRGGEGEPLPAPSGARRVGGAFLPPGSNPDLDTLRAKPSEKCWWCQTNPATTREHKHKATDLRRLATEDGVEDPSNLYRGGPGFNGSLRSLAKGSAVQWGKVMCKTCNGGRDRKFDEAYQMYADYVRSHQQELRRSRSMNWRHVFGSRWRSSATDLSRYFGKQLGCCLATQHLTVPDTLRAFLDGEPDPTDLTFQLHRSEVHAAFYDRGAPDGSDTCGLWLKSVPILMTSDRTRLVDITYGYGIGFVTATARWAADVGRLPNFFDRPRARLPMVHELDSPPLV